MRDRSILQSGAEETLAGCPESRRHSVFVGGFPCQDLSIAGKQAGLEGERSGLWREYKRVIKASQPEWIVIENVAHTWRRYVPELRSQLYQIGYASLPLRVRASDLGAPHQRARVFLVANANGELLRELSRWWCREGRQMAQELGCAWNHEPGIPRMDDGLSNRAQRNPAIGNAIVPQIAEIIATGIKEVTIARARRL